MAARAPFPELKIAGLLAEVERLTHTGMEVGQLAPGGAGVGAIFLGLSVC